MAEGAAQVVLVPAVFVARGVQAATEGGAGVPHCAGQVEAVALAAVGVVHHEALVMARSIAVSAFVEVPGDQPDLVDFVAGEEKTGGGFG
ncbi:hypothetical protein D3C81_1374810 [compost metagenome]